MHMCTRGLVERGGDKHKRVRAQTGVFSVGKPRKLGSFGSSSEVKDCGLGGLNPNVCVLPLSNAF